MAKKRSRARRSGRGGPTKPGAAPGRRRRLKRWQVAVGAAVLAAAAYGGWSWWSWQQEDVKFLAQAERGRPALKDVTTLPNEGRGHISADESVRYQSDPPTSGRHDPTPVDPGFYDRPQRAAMLVHSLEHGNIVIYYDQPGPEVLRTLKAWADLYSGPWSGGPWSGVVVTPKPGVGQAVVLTAWTRVLRLNPFDADAAAAFIDAYRGRGPEKPVR